MAYKLDYLHHFLGEICIDECADGRIKEEIYLFCLVLPKVAQNDTCANICQLML